MPHFVSNAHIVYVSMFMYQILVTYWELSLSLLALKDKTNGETVLILNYTD